VTFRGIPVEWHASIGSTNDEAFRRAAEGAPEGLVVAADTQTAGRGRQGRAWQDLPGRSLLFSILLEPALPLPSWPLLGLAMAASVAGAGRALAGAALDVKWPNDVLWRGRKVCGILAESRAVARGGTEAPRSDAGSAAGRPLLVIGTGINVDQAEENFPPDLRGRAASLRLASDGRALDGPIDRRALLADVLRRFEAALALARGGDPLPLFAALRPHLPAAGARVAVRVGDRLLEGDVDAVLETGALRVREAHTGALETIAAGELA
jgi:BirA family biotin operon repressor/biotin-[acetyl-CoA-carboxylase] ligase